MSKLSCETFQVDHVKIEIIGLENAVEINLEKIPHVSTGNSVTISNGTGQQSFQMDPNARIGVDWGYATSTIATNGHFECLGYRFFIKNGYLKCIKREISGYNALNYSGSITVSIVNVYGSAPKPNPVRETFYHPACIWDAIKDLNVRKKIQEAIVALAARKGIEIPKKFHEDGEQYNGVEKAYYFAALDWLAYPLLREIDSPAVCRNATHFDRKIISPIERPMNFKQLVEYYYGTSTNKMLEEIWKVIVVGGEYKRTQFAITPEYPGAALRDNFLLNRTDNTQPPDVICMEDQYVIQIGDRHIQTMVFGIGAAVFKAMGFDYFYQVAPRLGMKTQGRIHEGYSFGGAESNCTIEFNLKTLVKHVSPAKILSILFTPTHAPDLHTLYDTTRMLREYEDPQTIPKQLKLQYPRGLTVDFKFKTIKELHDKISTQYTIIKSEADNKEIPVADIYAMLDGRERDGCKLVVPRRTSPLSFWGKELSICIASYGDRAARGETLLLGVEKEGKIKYCIEFYCKSILQALKVEIVGLQTAEEANQPPTAIASPGEMIAYPKLSEKYIENAPEDVPDSERIYYIPSIVQFRSERNGNPDPKDKVSVENMLIEWTKENWETLEKLDLTREATASARFNAELGDLALRGGQADNMLVNPNAYNAYQNIMIDANAVRHVQLPNPAQADGRNFIVRNVPV